MLRAEPAIPESDEWYIEDQAFSRFYDLAPPPSLASKFVRRHTGRLRKRYHRKKAWSHMVLDKLFITLWAIQDTLTRSDWRSRGKGHIYSSLLFGLYLHFLSPRPWDHAQWVYLSAYEQNKIIYVSFLPETSLNVNRCRPNRIHTS